MLTHRVELKTKIERVRARVTSVVAPASGGGATRGGEAMARVAEGESAGDGDGGVGSVRG